MSVAKKRILVPVEYSGNLEDNQIGYYVGSMVDVHINGVLELNSPSDWIDARPSLIEQIKECLEDNYEGLFEKQRECQAQSQLHPSVSEILLHRRAPDHWLPRKKQSSRCRFPAPAGKYPQSEIPLPGSACTPQSCATEG